MKTTSLPISALALGAVLGGASGGAAWAQTAPQAAQVEPPASTSLDEIVVTAQRRSQNVQDVPLAVTAIGGKQLQASGIGNVQQLAVAVPGLQISAGPATTDPYLRGIGSQVLSPGAEKPVAIYVDDVYYAWAGGRPMNFINVDQIAVLRGPQGTLFGRNATGGVLQITTKTPTQAPAIEAEAGYGNYDAASLRFYASGGLAKNLAADISVQGSRSDGYGTNFATGNEAGAVDHSVAVRSKWVFDPRDSTRLTFVADYYDSDGSPRIPRQQAGTFGAYGHGSWDTQLTLDDKNEASGGGASLKVEQDFGFAQLMNIASYRKNDLSTRSDPDGTNSAPSFTSLLTSTETTYTEELQVRSHAGGALQWAVGLYYFHNEASFDPSSLVSGPFKSSTFATQTAESISGYGQMDWAFAKKTNLTLGARYTSEDRDLTARQTLPPATFNKSKSFSNVSYRLALDHHFSEDVMGYASISTGFKSGGFNGIQPSSAAYRPEEIVAYAVGVKSDIGSKFRVNAEAFYYDYTDLQVNVTLNSLPAVTNAGDAEIYGLDVDFTAWLTPDFNLVGGLELLHSELSNTASSINIGTPSGFGPLLLGKVDGNKTPYSSDTVISLAANYTVPMFGGKTLLNATYQYNSGYFPLLDNVIEQDAYSTVNLSARWSSADDRYSVRAWANNVTNEAVIEWANELGLGPINRHVVAFAPPRTFGVTLGYKY